MVEFSDNYGNVLESPAERIDCGGIWCVSFCLENLGCIFIINSFSYVANGSLCTLKGKSESKFVAKEFVDYIDLNDNTIVFFGIVLTWIGFGTVFEIKNGHERTVSPYLSAGTVR